MTSPRSVRPPSIPADSAVLAVPPWPVFRLGTAINDLFSWLAIATSLPEIRAMQLANVHLESLVTYAVVEHGIVEALVEGPRKCEAVASERGLVPGFCCRFMRAAAGLGILAALNDGTYALTPVGRALAGELQDFVRASQQKSNRDALAAAATTSIATGRSGYVEGVGKEFWDWHDTHPEEAKAFDSMMRQVTVPQVAALVASLELRGNETLCDVGGGDGTLLATFKAHWPSTTPVLFDLPGPVEAAHQRFAAMGERLDARPASFFDPLPIPDGHCDVLFLKSVLHDWEDQDALRILKNVKPKLAPESSSSRLVVYEAVLSAHPPSSGLEKSKLMLDITMLAINHPGARERTFDEYRDLLKAAGFTAQPTLLNTRSISSAILVPP
ncbi:hypothetical protein CTAYLR_007321 [Chrysophaeum taylorii]|uniref:Uncharacterized protein n=1 Tax=Chrysophaeum taylorii TaxID=2483200 RepID=A0AAD7U8U0_9STRA|nr:hypothetical protein CTAYLR_007321 [Chrysophaeum taylorii]